MSGKKFSAGLLVGVLLTIGVLSVVAVLTLNANAAMRLTSADLDRRTSAESIKSDLPKLGEVSFKGTVEAVNTDSYVVSGLTFRFDMQTVKDAGLKVGDVVEVKALMLPDQTRYALSIKLEDSLTASSEAEFEFFGIVESMGSAWLISGETVQVDASTTVDAGVDVGSLVEVKGTLVGSSLIASRIQLEDSSAAGDSSEKIGEVEFSGTIESISGGQYVIDGKTVMTDSSTEIKGTLAVGDFVKVEAATQSDGSLLAHEIEKEDDLSGSDESEDSSNKLEFTGSIESISGNVWVVSGFTIMVDASTEVEGSFQTGDQVKVEATLQSDGVTYLAHEIKAMDSSDDSSKDDQDDDQNDDQDEDQDDDQNDDQDEDHDEDHDDDSSGDSSSVESSFEIRFANSLS